MTRKPIVAVAIIAGLLVLTGCGTSEQPATTSPATSNPAPSQAGNTSPATSQSTSGGATLQDDPSGYIKEHLTGDFSITYKNEGPDGSSTVHVCTRTSEGYYWADKILSHLYVKNGDTYDQYTGTPSGGDFKKVTSEPPMSQQDFEKGEFAVLCTTPMAGFGRTFASYVEKMGSETILGRETDKYGFTSSGKTYTYWMDRETGVCLKSDDSTTKSEATEFILSGVTLPAHS